MVHWVYILECNDKFIYVGETIHLYKRLTQHIGGKGGKNTHAHIPKRLIGLYKVNDNQSFYDYSRNIKSNIFNSDIINNWASSGDNLFIENRFTERLFYERRNNHEYGTGKEWYRVRGGKYTRSDLDQSMYHAEQLCKRPNRVPGSLMMTTPIDSKAPDDIVDRPLCKCNMPCEVKISNDKKTIYFVCALKNVWSDFYKYIEVDDPCDFYRVYSDDRVIRTEWEIAKKKIWEQWCSNIPSTTSHYPAPCIKCNTADYIPMYSWYHSRSICQSCILSKYDELKREYSLSSECAITD